MYDAYHEELDSVGRTLVEMADLAGAALEHATAALLAADLRQAQAVIRGDGEVDALRKALDTRILELLARQQPVAGDPRTLVTSLRMSADLERMGDLARHIAKLARMRYPQPTIPQELHGIVAGMGRIGVDLAGKCAEIIEGKDAEAARHLEDEDDAVDHLHRALLDALRTRGHLYKIETVIDVTRIGCHYEHFADRALSVARRVVFLVTGDDLRIN